MDEKEFITIFKHLDETVLKPFLDEMYQESADRYNELISSGESMEEALHDVICKSSYITLKYAAMLTLFFVNDVDPDKPKSREELKAMLRLIKS